MPKGHPFPPEIRLEKSRERRRLWRRKYTAMHREKINAYKKEQYYIHKKTNSLRSKAYYQLNKETIKAKSSAYYATNKETIYLRSRLYVESHPEQVRLYNQTYYRKNASTINAKSLAYMSAHPEFVRQQGQRRRARKANAPVNDLTAAQWREIQDIQEHRCYYCGKRCKGHLTQDHIVPLSKGGSHTVTNVLGACKSCNSRKFTGPPPVPAQPLLLTVAPARKKKAS